MSLGRLILGAAALALAPAALAQPASVPAASPAASAEAARLAELLTPEAQIMRMVEPMFDATIRSRMASDPAAKAAFGERPEALAALRRRAVPEIQAILRETLPGMRVDVRDLILSKMTTDEIREVATFLTTPTGRKLFGSALEEVAGQGEGASKQSIAGTLISRMTPEELAEIERFGRTPAATKFGQVSSALGPVSERWARTMMRDHGPRIERAVAEAMAPYLPPSGKKK